MDYQNIDCEGSHGLPSVMRKQAFLGHRSLDRHLTRKLIRKKEPRSKSSEKFDKDLIKKGYTRIQEKIKETEDGKRDGRQNFSTKLTSSLLSINVVFPSRNVNC